MTTWYNVAKDFQTLLVGITALISAAIAYSAVTKRIKFDRKSANTERKRRKLGAFVRLESQMRRLAQVVSQKKMEATLDLVKGEVSEIVLTPELETKWNAAFSFDEFGEFDELEKAWKKIDLFPGRAIPFIDQLRSALIRLGENMTYCLAYRSKSGTKLILRTRNCLDNCDDAERQAGDFDKLLKDLIIKLKKVDWPEADEEDAFLQNDGAQG